MSANSVSSTREGREGAGAGPGVVPRNLETTDSKKIKIKKIFSVYNYRVNCSFAVIDNGDWLNS